MINPDTLSRDQKRFLKERYDLDFDKQRPYPNRAIRIVGLLSPWVHVILALGLLLEEPSVGTVFPSQPFEIITWGSAVFGLFVCSAGGIIILRASRCATSTDESGKDVWSWLFRGRIGFRSRWGVTTTGPAIGVAVMALLTGRIAVAAIYVAALVSLFAVERLFDHIVRGELVKVDRRARSSN